MTVVGKILVFVNLVFSLLAAGLIVMVYTTRTNWNAAFTTLTATNRVVRAQADADVQAAKERETASRTVADDLTRQRQALDDKLKAATADAERARGQYAALEQTQTAGQKNLVDLTEELNRRKAEVETAQKQKGELEKKISEVDQQITVERANAVQFRIQWEQAKERNDNLLRQNEALMREVGQLRQQSGAPRGTPPAGQMVARPPEELQGTIEQVNGDLATIKPGSDAGVAVGQKLTVERYYPRPLFLGWIEITRVEAHQAVGKLSGQNWRQITVGDKIRP
jgi:myosin heavy subunit